MHKKHKGKKEYTWVLWGIHPQKFAIFAGAEKATG